MGLSASNSYVQNTVNSLTSVVNSTVSNVTQDIQTSCSGSNIFRGYIGSVPTEVRPDGTIISSLCSTPPEISTLVVNQTASNTCGLKAGLTSQVVSNVNNDLATNINQWLKSEASANNGFLGFGVSIASAEGINDIQLSQQIADTVTSNIGQICNAALLASNTGDIYFCGNAPQGIYVTQSAVNTNLTSCIINNVVTSISNNQVLNDIVQKAAAKADAQNTGVDSILKWLIIGGIVLGVIVIIGVLLFLIFGSKGQPQGQTKEQQKEALQKRVSDLRERRQGTSTLRERERAAESRVARGEVSESREGERLGERYAGMGRQYGETLGRRFGNLAQRFY